MHFVFLWIQWSGKSIHAKRAVDFFSNCALLKMGPRLRMIAQENTPYGELVRGILDRGDLVSDEIVARMVCECLSQNEGKHIFFDGTPRHIDQKAVFEKHVPNYVLVYLTLSEEEAVRRISSRRIDPVTQEVFGADFLQDTNPKTGNKLVVRDDDTPEAVHHRIEIFKRDTFPIVEACKNEWRKVIEIDAHGTPNEVFYRLCDELAPYFVS